MSPRAAAVLQTDPAIPEGARVLNAHVSRAERRAAKAICVGLDRRSAVLEAELGLTRVEAPFGPPDDPVAARGWWVRYLDIVGAVGRQEAIVAALQAELAGGCDHVCACHPNTAAERLGAARAELAHLENAAARLGAARKPEGSR